MLTVDLLAYVRASLPEPPARVLEIGAGDGALAEALRDAGYEVTAIDPHAEPGGLVEPLTLLEAHGRFDAAVAIVSLHHVEPLEESCAHLAELLEPGGVLVIDELDSHAFDTTAATWWLGQRHALGLADEALTPERMVEEHRSHVHSVDQMTSALSRRFTLGAPVRGPYLHRWHLRESLRDAEIDLIASGVLPAVGWRQVAVRTVAAA